MKEGSEVKEGREGEEEGGKVKAVTGGMKKGNSGEDGEGRRKGKYGRKKEKKEGRKK